MNRRWSDTCLKPSPLVALVVLLLGFLPPVGLAALSEAGEPLPSLESVVPDPDSSLRELYAIEIEFSEPVQGVDASDLLISGSPATNVFQVELQRYLFSFPQPTDGLVTVSWAREHGIADTGGVRAFAGDTWSYTLASLTPPTGVSITEFMVTNSLTLADEDGEHPAWIELFNASTTTANLKGWFLTGDRDQLTRWRFPNVSILPGDYLLVWASGKDRTNIFGPLHTNFRPLANGGYLALVNSSTNIVSDFNPGYPPQAPDISYGRAPGAPHALGYFTQPTPGKGNSSRGAGFTSPVSFSRASCTFTQAFQLTLTTSDPNAQVRYTLDGKMPTTASALYTEPLDIIATTQVRARAFRDGLLPGPPCTEAYLQLSAPVLAFRSDLPVILLHTLGKGSPNATTLTPVRISVHEPFLGRSSLDHPATLSLNGGIKLRGSSTQGLAKSSYALELWDEFGQDDDHSLLGLPEDSDWVLYAPNIYEPVMIHNPFVHQLSREMGRYSPRTRFVEVYLVRNGQVTTAAYNGIYVLEEKIKIGKNRVAIDRLQPEDLSQPAVTGGYLLKIDRLDPGDGGISAGGTTLAYVDPKEREAELPQRAPQLNYLRGYFNSFSAALSGSTWKDPTRGYAAYIDVDAWIDFHTLEVLSGNVDTLVLSTYFHKPRNGKIVFGPHWDFDRALGSTDGRDANARVWSTGPFFSATWWNRLFTDPDFWQRWVDRWQQLRQSTFSESHLYGLIDQLASEVRQAQPRETAKWRTALRGGSFQSEVNLMKKWVSNRVDFIDRQLTQPPQLSSTNGILQPSYLISLTKPTNATVYFTLDGSDPRAPGGALSSAARVYSNPFMVITNARVVARARDLTKKQSGGPPVSTPWSRSVAATYLLKPAQVVLTEVMFHPAPPTAGTNAVDDFQYLELKNAGSEAVNLVGYSLTNCVAFAFTTATPVTTLQPGERLLVVNNLAAFRLRYPLAKGIAGEFVGNLNHAVNRVTLLGPLREIVFDVVLEDSWAPLADGFGFSVVLADETTPPDRLGDPTRWRVSTELGGSPGVVDPAPLEIPRVLINEVVSNPSNGKQDAVELFNPGPSTADISGWWLSDDLRTPRKYRLQAGTILPAGQFLVVLGTALNSGANPFGLSAQGDEIYLFSADVTGALTGWVHGFSFGPQDSGTSFVRWVTSDGLEHLTSCVAPTLGLTNGPPAPSPLVFSEILYAPPLVDPWMPSVAQFIELKDTTRGLGRLALYEPGNPTNTWHLRGDVDFDFPAGFVMPVGGRVVLVGFDPLHDADALTLFRAWYRLDPGVVLLGPWRGTLKQTGSELRLCKPLPAPSDPQKSSHMVVTQLRWATNAPWPADVSGTGMSMEPSSLMTFQNEPALWQSAVPTPGDADTDRDGLPNLWEAANGLSFLSAIGNHGADGDADQDGFSNLQEFLMATSPVDSASFPRLQVSNGTSVQVSFQGGPNRLYQLLGTDRITNSTWQVLQRFATPPEGAWLWLDERPTNAARFYRLEAP
jgi:hypothetical protein